MTVLGAEDVGKVSRRSRFVTWVDGGAHYASEQVRIWLKASHQRPIEHVRFIPSVRHQVLAGIERILGSDS